jgi:transcriptional regulator with XRE-family HTH domain
MKKILRVGKRIKKLREAHGWTQAKFAKNLGVSQGTVSAWESGKDFPSPTSWLALGKMAPASDRFWFWQKGGMDLERMVSSADTFLKERKGRPKEAEVARVSWIQRNPDGTEHTGSLVALPAEFIPHPASTNCLLLDETYNGGIFSPGEAIVVDASQARLRTVAPFWGRLALVEFNPSPSEIAARLPHSWEGRYIGRVAHGEVYGGKYRDLVYVARLEIVSDPRGAGNPFLGTWKAELSPRDFEAHQRDDERGREICERYKRRAMKEMEFSADCTVLGEVIGWLRSPKAAKQPRSEVK